MEGNKENQSYRGGRLLYCMRCFPFCPPNVTAKATVEEEADHEKGNGKMHGDDLVAAVPGRKPGGWKSMPYIIGNETFERLATFGMIANMTVYLVNHLHMKQVKAANLANIWFGTTNFAPLLGAFLSDAYLGRCLTLAIASVASFLVAQPHILSLSLSLSLTHTHTQTNYTNTVAPIAPSRDQEAIGPTKLTGINDMKAYSGGILRPFVLFSIMDSYIYGVGHGCRPPPVPEAYRHARRLRGSCSVFVCTEADTCTGRFSLVELAHRH